MTADDQTAMPGNPWEAAALRVTVFPSDGVSAQPGWWKQVVGQEPETRTVRPKQQSLQEEGDFDKGRLRLVVQPARIDWLFFVPEREGEESEEPFRSLGPLSSALGVFSGLIEGWLRGMAPETKRLAFGAISLREVADRAEGYRQLQALLPNVKLDQRSSDFLYQINRRCQTETGIEGLEINRLSKWSVTLAATMILNVQVETVTRIPGSTQHALRLELDINTAPEFPSILPRGRLLDLYSELVQLGEEIAAKGDIA